MNILAIDTTAEALSLALSAGARVYSYHKKLKAPHDETLLAAAQNLLKRAGMRLHDLDALAAASGPGRFTGIRIGMAYAVIAASRLKIPALAVSLLEAVAFKTPGRRVCAVVPGFKNEKYYQLFERRGRILRPAQAPGWVEESAWAQKKKTLEHGDVLIAEVSTAAQDLIAPALAGLKRKRLPAFEPLYLKPAGYERALVR